MQLQQGFWIVCQIVVYARLVKRSSSLPDVKKLPVKAIYRVSRTVIHSRGILVHANALRLLELTIHFKTYQKGTHGCVVKARQATDRVLNCDLLNHGLSSEREGVPAYPCAYSRDNLWIVFATRVYRVHMLFYRRNYLKHEHWYNFYACICCFYRKTRGYST